MPETPVRFETPSETPSGTPVAVAPLRQAASWGLPAALVLLILTLLLVYVRLEPPAPKPASAPAAEFAAGRARAVLAELAGDGRPTRWGAPPIPPPGSGCSPCSAGRGTSRGSRAVSPVSR